MHAFDILGEPVRRRILELLGDGELTAGALCEVIQREFGISQPAVSQHLKVLRDNGFATVRPEGARRLYAVSHEPLRDIDAWLDQFRRAWTPHLDALATELARGKQERRKKS
ncbi:ArsR/SmtB family transcription factor [Streptomyces sp. NPDC088762]|uniref:ArsR/SmtB family transcription factor n=1 Tax=Streptomyces sp. NPDC088762 TaxID=3365891 RepID=UPI0038028644